MVAKSERLKELEARERELGRMKARERTRLGIVGMLVGIHRLEPGKAFEEADKVLAHPRAGAVDAIEESHDVELERVEEAKAQELERIRLEAVAEARAEGSWPDGSPFVEWPGLASPPAVKPPAAPPPETPAGPPAGEGEAGDAPPSAPPPEVTPAP